MEEEILWRGKSSHVKYFITYSIMIIAAFLIYFKGQGYYRYLLVIPAIWNVWNYLTIELSSIILTNQRLFIKHGIFNRYQEEVELFRIKDISVNKPFLYRLNRCSTLILVTSDKSTPKIVLLAIPEADSLKDLLRDKVVEQRKIHQVREMDINN